MVRFQVQDRLPPLNRPLRALEWPGREVSQLHELTGSLSGVALEPRPSLQNHLQLRGRGPRIEKSSEKSIEVRAANGEGKTKEPLVPPPAKVPVTFRAHRLFYARLRVGENMQLDLNPHATRELAPGSYPLEVRLGKDNDEWESWGVLEILPGKSNYQVKLLPNGKFEVIAE